MNFFNFGKKDLKPIHQEEELIKDNPSDRSAEDVQSIEEVYSLASSNLDEHDFSYYQEKLELEKIDMENLMKASVLFTKKGEKDAIFQELKLSDEEIKDLANIYPDYLASLNEYGLPFAEEEVAMLNEGEKEEYKKLKEELLQFEKGLNNDFDEDDDSNYNVYSQEEAQEYFKLFKAISSLEARLKSQIRRTKNQAEKAKNPEFKDISRPEYSEFDIKMQDLAYNKVVNKDNAPLEIEGQQLSDAEVAELALEAITRKSRAGEIILGNFIAGKGKNQLVMKKRIAKNRDMLYVANGVSDDKAGEYVCTMDLDTMKVLKLKKGEKIDPKKYNIAIVSVNLDVDVNELKKLASQRRNRQEKEEVI